MKKANLEIKRNINIILDVIIILLFIWIVIALQTNFLECDHDGWSTGLKFFKYFTNIGNILLFISSLISLYYTLTNKDKTKLSSTFRLVGTTCTSITLLTTYSSLAVVQGWNLYFSVPVYLFEHTIIPVCGILQLLFFDDNRDFIKRDSLFSVIPLLLYLTIWILVLLILNLPKEIETDFAVVPYYFLQIHNQPVMLTIIYVIIGVIAPFLISLFYIN